MPKTYSIPAEEIEVETEVKKSRFIARVCHVSNKEQAKSFVEKAKQDYPDARHHCWAYLLGNPHTNASAAANDAGEPSGTAGKPILNVIQHKGIGDVIVVVIRYFGGIKLGAGGLTRAYSGAAESVLSQVALKQLEPRLRRQLIASYDKEQVVRYWLDKYGGRLINIEYQEQCKMDVEIAEKDSDNLKAFCLEKHIEQH